MKMSKKDMKGLSLNKGKNNSWNRFILIASVAFQ